MIYNDWFPLSRLQIYMLNITSQNPCNLLIKPCWSSHFVVGRLKHKQFFWMNDKYEYIWSWFDMQITLWLNLQIQGKHIYIGSQIKHFGSIYDCIKPSTSFIHWTLKYDIHIIILSQFECEKQVWLLKVLVLSVH